MREVILHPEARQEMRSAAFHYEECRVGLGDEFVLQIERTLQSILTHPDIGRPMDLKFRRLLVPRFPYGIIYRQGNDIIYVVAIMHQKRKPGYWKRRIDDDLTLT